MLVLDDQQGAEDPEDRARRSHGHPVRGRDQRACRAGKPGDEVHREVAKRAEVGLDPAADHVEDEHVEADVEDAPVQEGRGDQPPPASMGDLRPIQPPLCKHLAARLVDAGALRDRDQIDEHVHADQPVRHDGDAAGPRRHPHSRPHAPRSRPHVSVIGAARPDGRHGHALGADRALALGAGEAGLAVRMAVAVRDAFSVSTCASTSRSLPP